MINFILEDDNVSRNNELEQEHEVDEFGRIKKPMYIGSDVSNAVRQRRRQQRDHRRFLRNNNIPVDELEEEGFSTDEELDKNDEKETAGKIGKKFSFLCNNLLFSNTSS
jgi:hypothetical protein